MNAAEKMRYDLVAQIEIYLNAGEPTLAAITFCEFCYRCEQVPDGFCKMIAGKIIDGLLAVNS